jgi:hypothetical protein
MASRQRLAKLVVSMFNRGVQESQIGQYLTAAVRQLSVRVVFRVIATEWIRNCVVPDPLDSDRNLIFV